MKPRYSVKMLPALMLAPILTMTDAFAHHSFAMFDNTNVVSLDATVKEFQWTNPHVIIWVYVRAKDDQMADMWSIELSSPGNLTRSGWSRKSLKVGDKLNLVIHPLRDGSHGGSFKQATIVETGQVLLPPELGAQEKPNLQ